MSKTTTMNFSIKDDLKKNFSNLAKSMWTNPSNLLQMMMTNAVNTWKLSFEAYENYIDSIYTEEDEKALERAMEDYKNWNTYTLSEIEESLNKKEICTK